MKRLRTFATCGFVAVLAAVLSVVSCTDDNLFNGDIVVPKDVDLTQLEQYSYVVPLEIKSDTEWEIDFDFAGDGESICYALPKSGKGNATVKLCVLDNWTDVRREGTMYITYPNDPGRNKEIPLGQKCNLDQPETGIGDITQGDRIYGVGYGYNYLGEYASTNSVSRCPIIKIEECKDKIETGGVDATIKMDTYSGSNVEELMNKLNAKANFGGKYLGFKGEVGATFGTTHFENTSHEYAITYVEKSTRRIYCTLDRNDIIDEMTDNAYNAINGLPVVGKRGTHPTQYPNTLDGMKKLISDYGTHLLTTSLMGGRVKYSMTVDVSKVEGCYDLNAFAKCSYEGAFGNASGSVADSLHASYKNNSSACKIELDVNGGTLDAADKLAGEANKANATAWLNTINDLNNAVLIGLDPINGMIPLYDLIDMNTPGAQERYEFMKDYILGLDGSNALEEATSTSLELSMNYENGVTAHVQLPSFISSSNVKPIQTLVSDVYSTGQRCARVCEEFIPVINAKERVKVVYPIVSNKVKYNMGMFVGDATHKPAKVCWQGNNLSVVECNDLPIGEMKDFYIRGSHISGKCYGESVNTTNEGVYMSGARSTASDTGGNGKYTAYTVNSNYPLVKIFDKIWTREDYQGVVSGTGQAYEYIAPLTPIVTSTSPWVVNAKSGNKIYYGRDIMANTKFAPSGWKLPSSSDYKTISETLTKQGFSSPGREFIEDGHLGFCAFMDGYVKRSTSKDEVNEEGAHAYYWTSDGQVAMFGSEGSFNTMTPSGYSQYFQMRMVAE